MKILKLTILWYLVFSSAVFAAGRDKQLILGENEVRELRPGKHHFDSLELRSGSKLVLLGTTEIFTEKLITKGVTDIVYKQGAGRDDKNKNFIINALDASGVSFLRINVDGADGKNAPQNRAPNGAHREKTHSLPGHNGAHGGNAENAFDVTLYLPKLPEPSTIIVSASGGEGGKGQPAGNGGRGNSAGGFRGCRNGGNAGAGGNGGLGGDAGQVSMFLVVDNINNPGLSKTKAKEKMKKVALQVSNGRGEGGRGGRHGQPGQAGNCGPINPKGLTSFAGKPVTHDNDGKDGAGPIKNGKNADWVKVDVMMLSSFLQFYLAKTATLNN